MNALNRGLLFILSVLGLASFQSVSYSAPLPSPPACSPVISSATVDCQLPASVVTVTGTGEINGDVSVVNLIPGAEGIINSGRLAGVEVGIFNMPSASDSANTIQSISNLNSGIIGSGSLVGIVNQNGIIQNINNAGEIRGNQVGIFNIAGSIHSLTNHASGTINTLVGADIAESSWAAVWNYGDSTITQFNNAGLIIGNAGIYNAEGASISTLVNFSSGTIGGYRGIQNSSASTITTLYNSGLIRGDRNSGIENIELATIGTLTNAGVISGQDSAIANAGGSTITNLINLAGGSILGDAMGIYNVDATIALLSNAGRIDAVSFHGIDNSGTIGVLNNSGTISGGDNGIVNVSGTINRLDNSGSIVGQSYGVRLYEFGTLDIFVNSGIVAVNSDRSEVVGVFNSGPINTFTNTGAISAVTSAGIATGVNNQGAIATFNNAQGGNALSPATTALTYVGNLPTSYNIIINSTTHYGQLVSMGVAGSTIFGISSLSTASRSIINATFASVLTGISADQLGQPGLTSISGVSSIYSYILTLTDSDLNIWGLTITACQVCKITIVSGETVTLSQLVGEPNLIMAGGTLALSNGDQSSQNFAVVSSSTITAPASGSATLSGIFSGVGGLTFNGTGTTILTGANTYSGGTTIASGTLSVAGSSPTGTGDVFVASGGTLMGTGTITGNVIVSGILKPGNSPGYLSTTSTVTMNAGSSYVQDIAGTAQASSTSPVGATGYYSFLNVTNGQFVIQPGSTLTPRLSNLFSSDQSGYGSAIYVPGLGDRLRIVTADGGISGRFSTVTQPAELTAGTQFLPFYNMAGSNSIDLAVIPTSYQTTIASASGNANAQSVGGALTQLAQASLAGTATVAQDQLLYAISGLTSAQGIANLAQRMSGEVYAATVAVMAQTTQRTQQAVLNRLGDTAGLGLNMPMASTNLSTQVGGAPSAAVSTNPNVNPNAEAKSYAKGNVWGELAYQRGNRASDSQSGGWSSNLYQLTFGSDFYSSNGTTAGAGFALSSTTLNPVYGSSTIQQGSLFAYGKMPVQEYVVDAMASVGLSSSDIKRGDITGLSADFRNNSVSGNDVMLSVGLSRPFDTESVRITPFARITWQMVMQSGVNEGDAVSALNVNRYTGNGLRGVIGVAAGSKASNPMTAKHTYRAYVGVGADSSGLLNPTLNASLAGMNTNITTPNAGTTFVQAGLYGTAKMSENTFAYAGISGEGRSGQTLGTINLGLKVQF